MTMVMTDVAESPVLNPVPSNRSISVIVTAMNEEGNLERAVDSVLHAVVPRFSNYEVIVVDDGSTDRTPEIARKLAARNHRIRVHRHTVNLGLGQAYRLGIQAAAHEHVSWVAGNNLVPSEALERVYDRIGERDMVISYIEHDVRPFTRRALSRLFTIGLNVLFSVRVRYYTGPCVFRTAVAKRLPGRAQGSFFVAELLVRLLRAGQTYVEVPVQPLPRTSGTTKTFRPRNVANVFVSVFRLFWELRVRPLFASGTPAEVCVSDRDQAVRSR